MAFRQAGTRSSKGSDIRVARGLNFKRHRAEEGRTSSSSWLFSYKPCLLFANTPRSVADPHPPLRGPPSPKGEGYCLQSKGEGGRRSGGRGSTHPLTYL